MKLEINKNELERALIALGKLVSRTASLPQFRSLKIEMTEKEIHFSTCSALEQITFRMESPSEGSFLCVVSFEKFRMALCSCRNKMLELEYGERILRVGETTLLHEQSVEWPVFCKGEQEAFSELPKEFVSLLAKAAPLVDREEVRSIVRGINLSREGISATNGRELLHIPLPLNVDDFTIPLPIALLQTRTKEGGNLVTWNSRAGKICRVETEHWIWQAYGLKGNYPDWRQIIPHQNSLVRSVSFLPERGEQLAIFLKNVPAQEPHNPVELYQSEDPGYLNILAGEMHSSIAADFSGDWSDFSLKLNRKMLLRMLSEGHTKIEAGDGHFPILATGGTGRYVTLPLYQPNPKTTTQIQTQTEEPKMENNEMRVVSAPVQTVVCNPEPVPEAVDPMEELNHGIDELRGRLKLMLDETGVLTRKVKEAVLRQKQKERDFILAKRAIERIKMAI